jgi:hypothetical protein
MNHTTSTTIDHPAATAAMAPAKRRSARPLPRALLYRTDPAAIAADEAELWAMTVAQRIDLMWAGLLTGTQLTAWSGRYPQQVPCLGGELAYLVMHTDEFLEDRAPTRTRRTDASDTVVELPSRGEVDRAAA